MVERISSSMEWYPVTSEQQAYYSPLDRCIWQIWNGRLLPETEWARRGLTTSTAFSRRFSTRLRPQHINVKETQAILHSLRIWLAQFRNSHLIIHCDNEAVAIGFKVDLKRRGHETATQTTNVGCFKYYLHWLNLDSYTQQCLADLLSRGKFKLMADKFPLLQTMAITIASENRLKTGILKSY